MELSSSWVNPCEYNLRPINSSVLSPVYLFKLPHHSHFLGMPLDLSGMNLADHPEPEHNYLSRLVASLTGYLLSDYTPHLLEFN